MIDREALERKLASIGSNLMLLGHLAGMTDAEFDGDVRNRYTALHLLQVSIEAMLDCVEHVIARMRLGAPSDGREAWLLMRDHGLLPAEHVRTYLVMNAFRNRVVHLYDEVSVEEVKRILREDLGDFVLFIADVRALYAKAAKD